MAAIVKAQLTAGQNVLVVVNKYTAALFSGSSDTGPWAIACAGELGTEFFAVAKAKSIAKRLWVHNTLEPKPWALDPSALPKNQLVVTQLTSWMKSLDGRHGHASPETKAKVAGLAANRCQFAGCGEDLSAHLVTGRAGNFSYFAHIIAASEDGPRGHATLSAQLADAPDNFLLLCDKCHRLVDKVDPDSYPTDKLQNMRNDAINEVRRLLDTLRYPEVERLYIVGNVTGQMPHISDRDVDSALWKAKLRSSPKAADSVFSFGGAHHAPHDDAYWPTVFKTLQFDLPLFQSKLNGVGNSGRPRPPLAVFPLHGTSILILAGRILGDMAGTHVFQPHRNKVGEHMETRWAWPDDGVSPAPGKYQVKELKPNTAQSDEAALLVSLTYGITTKRLPSPVVVNDALAMPTLEITVDNPNPAIIRHPDDLVHFGAAVDDALRTLQDTWKVKKVHLFVGAPTSAALLVGQKMQARHQATFYINETLPNGPESVFAPTIAISATAVSAIRNGQSVSLQT
ncbi:SAVED domain-containing protein [Pseudoduganella namucuonensis]|uniref:SAVED domain-containing protein n=1 Tax=Pseudoduganella namucuonensis TaxID=1035707 RepID=UPI000B897249|nr:SAVED domain-containing protein [Pseudoduganella namucuonensis]